MEHLVTSTVYLERTATPQAAPHSDCPLGFAVGFALGAPRDEAFEGQSPFAWVPSVDGRASAGGWLSVLRVSYGGHFPLCDDSITITLGPSGTSGSAISWGPLKARWYLPTESGWIGHANDLGSWFLPDELRVPGG